MVNTAQTPFVIDGWGINNIPDGKEVILVDDIGVLSPNVFPDFVREIEFSNEFKSLLPGSFPKNLVRLKFGEGFQGTLHPGDLPDGLKELIFSFNYKQIISPGVIPGSVEVLESGYKGIGIGVLPKNLKSLRISNFYEEVLEVGVFPPGLETLHMGMRYKHPFEVGMFPEGLKILVLPNNHPGEIIPGLIPRSVIDLVLNSGSNVRILENVLPRGLKKLKLGLTYNQPIPPGIIPEGLEELDLGAMFNQDMVVGSIPRTVRKLIISRDYDKDISPGVIPGSMRSITFYNYVKEIVPGALPEGVEEIDFGTMFNHSLGRGVLPTTVRKIKLSIKFNQPIEKGDIPVGVEDIDFGYRFDSKISPGALPSSLKRLRFGFDFNQFLTPGMLPESVEELEFGTKFNQPVFVNTLPPKLRKLTFGYGFSEKLPVGSIPQTVEELMFGSGYVRELQPGIIPSNLKILRVSGAYKGRYFRPELIPQSLEKFYIGETEVKIDIFRRWMNFIQLVHSGADGDIIRGELEKLYLEGIPVPVEPHESSILPVDNRDLKIIREFSVERGVHADVFDEVRDDLYNLINKWIYGDYASFNVLISHLNMGQRLEYSDSEFVEDYLAPDGNLVDAAISAYHDFRQFILDIPRVDHKIYAWRGLHGLNDLCQVSAVGSYIAFTRFMACSVAQEVSCSFARDGILLLVELPANTPLINMTSIKNSEPEFVIPDRTVFKVVNRITNQTCQKTSCREIVHICLVGLYTEDERGNLMFEEYYSKEPMDVVDIQHFY